MTRWEAENAMPCYAGLGDMTDGRPVFVGHFQNSDFLSREILVYYPAEHTWWLGTFSGPTLTWTKVGDTVGFGDLADGRPMWAADFTGSSRTEILFYFPGDGNWWLGSMAGGRRPR